MGELAHWPDKQAPGGTGSDRAGGSAEEDAEASEQPLYNPELSVGADRTGSENNFEAGLSQTIDWSDQQGALQDKAKLIRLSAEAGLSEQF